jgi:hypothetical protein
MKPYEWGERSVDLFWKVTGDYVAINFSSPVAGGSIMVGNYGGGDSVFLRAFSDTNCMGLLLAEDTQNIPGGSLGFFSQGLSVSASQPPGSLDFFWQRLSVSVSELLIRSLAVGTFNPGRSFFGDNVVATVPEPRVHALLAAGCLLVVAVRFRRRFGRW